MPEDLTDNNVANTYKGLLHASGEELPESGLVDVYDGAGNLTPIRIGLRQAGISLYSLSSYGLSANGLEYPRERGEEGDVVTQTKSLSGNAAQLSLSAIKDVVGAAGGIVYTPEPTQYTTDADLTPGVTIPNHIVAPQVDRGVIIGMRSRPVSEITAADGGVSRTSAATSSNYISNLVIKGGLVTGVTFGLSGSSGSGSVLAKGYICFNGNTGAVIASSNLTVSRTGIGVYAVTLNSSIRIGSSNYAAIVGAIDSGTYVSASFDDGSMDVRTIGIDTYTDSGFIVRAMKRYNVDIVHRGGDDNNSIHRWAGIATDASRITVAVY